jgi:hypothetical protein
LQIGDRDNYGNYWDGGRWRDRDYWHRNYEWRDHRWRMHDRGWHRGWDKRDAYERGYREGWNDRDDPSRSGTWSRPWSLALINRQKGAHAPFLCQYLALYP